MFQKRTPECSFLFAFHFKKEPKTAPSCKNLKTKECFATNKPPFSAQKHPKTGFFGVVNVVSVVILYNGIWSKLLPGGRL